MRTRVANWPAVLNAEIDQWRTRPFKWGEIDCCQFPAAVIRGLTGEDFLSLFPAYASQEEAQAILAGFGDLAGLITHALGEPKPVAWAHRGDLVLIEFGMGPTAAICLGVHCCAPGRKGLEFELTAKATLAWSV